MILFDVCNESYLLKTAESAGWWVYSPRVQQMLAQNVSADVVKMLWNISSLDCCGDTDWNGSVFYVLSLIKYINAAYKPKESIFSVISFS